MIGFEVEGLSELRHALKQVSNDLPDELTSELRNSSVMFQIRTAAVSKLSAITQRSGRSTGRAMGSIRLGSVKGGVYIAGGKTELPYYPWLEFGGDLKPTGGRHNTIHRNFQKEGRALYPSVAQHMDGVRSATLEAFDNMKRKAGLK